MKLSAETINVIKNFSTINQGLIFPAGFRLRTISGMQNILASAIVNDEFPRTFAIYDLMEFLGTLSLFNNPDLEFFDNYFTIVEGPTKVKYFYCNPSVVFAPPDREIKFEDQLVEFTLLKDTFLQLQKAASVMRLSDLVITDNEISLTDKSDSSNRYSVSVPMAIKEKDHTFVIKIADLRIIPLDYIVRVNSRMIYLENLSLGLEYHIALENFK